ncbi:MAG: hypothetical protein JOZ90_06205 [Alphaproteobacteria bacterium]|nr:hypothetical protein [Alphaproteobacteria bacterium]MBV9372703.1 hypothetical protein [Alphaproteobacteria bacterium]MBV9900672.1 hypothetical protein [Alphaproteobacteria bacterium]
MPEAPTLADLLPERLDRMGDEAKRKLCENEEIGCMKLAWDFIASELRGAIAAALDCPLMEVLAETWAQAQLLAEHAHPERHPPGERSVVEIGAHDVSHELAPVVTVTVGQCPPVELEFTLTVTAHFGGVKLAVQDGHILGGRLGEAWASGQLAFEGVPLHGEAESGKTALPGEFRFAPPGVAIPRLQG